MRPCICSDCDLRDDSSDTERKKKYVLESITEKVKLWRLYFFARRSHFWEKYLLVFSSLPFPRFAVYFQLRCLFASEKSPSCFCLRLCMGDTCVYINLCLKKLSIPSNQMQNFHHKLDPQFPLHEWNDPPLFGSLSKWWDSMRQSKHLYVYMCLNCFPERQSVFYTIPIRTPESQMHSKHSEDLENYLQDGLPIGS